MIRFDYVVGTVGVLLAVLGYAARATSSQVSSLEHGEGLQAEQSKLQSIAWTDALTGLGNRHFLDQALGLAAQKAGLDGHLCVLMIDIDHFKLLNDRYGHVVGDQCLRSVASALQRSMARPNDVLARYGGEEFIALLHGTDGAGAKVVAERVRAAVQSLKLEHLGSPFGTVTVSVGAASAPTRTVEPAALVEAADGALYDAKRSGRNQIKVVTH
jgi:diguanylate cyclase (GGDEF)-like protein